MSLINDALRKAQAEANCGRLKPVATGMIGMHGRSTRKTSWTKILVGVLFILISAWAVTVLLNTRKDSDSAVVARASTAPEETMAPAQLVAISDARKEVEEPAAVSKLLAPEPPISETPVQPERTPESPQTPPQAATPVPAPVTARESSPTVEDPPAPSVTQATTASATPSKALAGEAAPVEAEAIPDTAAGLRDEIVFTLKYLDVTAVMGDGKEARIMSEGQIHRAGELINLDLRIRFQGKKGSTLYFTDEKGEIYQKSL